VSSTPDEIVSFYGFIFSLPSLPVSLPILTGAGIGGLVEICCDFELKRFALVD
jgi:hypothetical protein